MSVSVVPAQQTTRPSSVDDSSQSLSMTSKDSQVKVANTVIKKWSKGVRLLPIGFFFVYLNFTVLLFAFGPWPYPVRDGTKLYFFLTCAHLALVAGYVSAANSKPSGYFGRCSVDRLVLMGIVVNLLVFFPTSFFMTGDIIPDVRSAFQDLGTAYAESHNLRQENSPIIMYLRMFVSPLTVLLLPLTIYYWKKLKPFLRYLATVTILGDIALYIAIGTNAGIARFFLVSSWLFLASYLSAKRKLKWTRGGLRILVLGVVALLVVFLFFTLTMLGRSGVLRTYYFTPIGIYADTDHFMVRNLPTEIQTGIIRLSSYVTQGYYALYLSLKEPFIPMFGVGHSLFLFRQAARITGIHKIMYLPYPVRIEKYGWDAYGNWSTIYPWIASDASFPGTVLIVFFIGRLFALSWLDTLKGDNLFAVVMFSQLLMILFFFPATNQWLQGGEGLVAFWITLLVWLFTRKQYVLRPRRSSA